MTYELTHYGEEYLETLPKRMDDIWQRLPKVTVPGGGERIVRNTKWYQLNKRQHILDRIRRGDHPIEGSFDFLPAGPRLTRAQNSLQRELDWLISVNAVREVT